MSTDRDIALAQIETNRQIYAASEQFREALLNEMERLSFVPGSGSHRLHIDALGPALPLVIFLNPPTDRPMKIFGAEVVLESDFAEGQWELRPSQEDQS